MAAHPLVLQRVIGLAGSVQGSVSWHPNGRDVLRVAGGSIVVGTMQEEGISPRMLRSEALVTCVAFAPSGRFVATGHAQPHPDVVVWDYETGRERFRFCEYDHGVQTLVFSSDEQAILTVGVPLDKRMFLVDVDRGTTLTTAALHPMPTTKAACTLVPPGKDGTAKYRLATAGAGTIVIWEWQPGHLSHTKCLAGEFVRDYTCLTFSADGKVLFAGSISGDVSLIDATRSCVMKVVPAVSGGLTALVPLSDGVLMGGSGGGSLFLLRPHEKKGLVVDREGPTRLSGAVTSISFSPDRRTFLAGTSQGFMNRVEFPSMSPILIDEAHCDGVTSISFQPPGVSEQLASCGRDGVIRMWDCHTWKVLWRSAPLGGIQALSLGFGRDLLITGWSDEKVRCHSVATGELFWSLDNVHRGGVTAVAIPHSQKFFVTGGAEGDVRIWDTPSRRMLTNLKQHTGRINHILLSRDGTQALSCSRDRSFMSWDTTSFRRLTTHTQPMGGVTSMALHPDQNTVVTVGQQKCIAFWKLNQADVLRQSDREDANSVAFSPDGKLFVTGGNAGDIKVWDTNTAKEIVPARSIMHTGTVTALAFSPDGRLLTTGGEDGCILVWRVEV
eukprot:TRINITY_DN35503_c0_g1_i1.p1 TRINITY_DN35503_c0_g1~~TRINITY_DN35503_c0_g1_i1.p1  ORF type:complete len:632 (+),score=100.18 TRINITY_DN35503_c0_g1_i1:61-1896(+)